jgi:hypothetical protein
MKLTLAQALDALSHGETSEQYMKRMRRIRRLANERDDLMDWLEVNDTPEDAEVAAKKRERLNKVLTMIDELK